MRLLPLRCAARVSVQAGRRFTTSSPRRSLLTAQEAADRLVANFGGNKTFERRQLLDGNQLQKLLDTLNRPTGDVTPANGTPIPPGYHLVYFTPTDAETSLGRDGTDKTFNAPAPFTRRMWAGGTMRWDADADLRVGDEVTEITRLVSATPKKSSSVGEMVVVEVEKEFVGSRGRALRDRRSWVFRPEIDETLVPANLKALDVDVRAPSVSEDVKTDDGNGIVRQVQWSPVALFRFSALTFNAHKIHYNEDWTRRVEGHPGVVVHGPLNLISMLDYWRDVHGSSPTGITYRAMSPLYAGERYQISSKRGEGQAGREIVVEKSDGTICMKAQVNG
ncbi:putative cytoplasmic protein [Emericellopsis atlantica]|uniref:Cytoplasmic protein n=1 Tax=Emericellopsis atlantica TaxID=2614577 RepID=A0A9P7ZPL7_9HYPO|nr:putative cytoplasmic protein [Emericellopsis atlantica]KAG9255497.1 putative cytoplasmic protein [Emericellopsis atlantica]